MSRSELESRFRAATTDAKTWVVEAHPRGERAMEFLREHAEDAEVTAEDGTLSKVKVDDDLTWWVDTATPRFWRFHTWATARDASRWLRDRIERTSQLDWTWLPSGQLRVAGSNNGTIDTDFGGQLVSGVPKRREVILKADPDDRFAQRALEYLRGSDSPVVQYMSVSKVRFVNRERRGDVDTFARLEVSRDGRIMAAGNDWNLHGRSITAIVRRYAKLIDLVENRRISFKWGKGSTTGLSGSPITLRYEPVDDLDTLLEGLFSCRTPFRLWGTPREIGDSHWMVEASDLHVGQRLSIEIGASWLRVYLRGDEICGNTVVRLASNLEHHLDARLHFSDPELNAAFIGQQALTSRAV